MSRPFAFLLFLLATSPVAASERFVSEDGRFAVEFPLGPPSRSERTVVSDLGDIELRVVTSTNEDDSEAFLVTYVDYPSEKVRKRGAEVLRSAVEGLVGDEGIIRTNSDLRFRKMAGKEVHFEKAGSRVYARVFLVGNRLYQLLALSPSGELQLEKVKAFFESFQIST